MTGDDRPVLPGEAIEIEPAIRDSKRAAIRRLIDLWCEAEPGRMQLDLAKSLGVHPVTLSRWRSGERAAPDWTLAWVAESVGVEVSLDSTAGWLILEVARDERAARAVEETP